MAYGRVKALLVLVGMGPRFAGVELDATALTVRMGWGFRASIPRASIHGARRERNWPWAIGVHTNFAGSWLVNGSADRLVSMEVSPPAAGRCMGVPVTVRRLGLSLEDPDGFLADLQSRSGTP